MNERREYDEKINLGRKNRMHYQWMPKRRKGCKVEQKIGWMMKG